MPDYIIPAHMIVSEITLSNVTVRFDGCSHSSGLQRGYITCRCSKDHDGCHKYRFTRDFGGDKRKTAAWLMAWNVAAPKYTTRQTHYKYEPRTDHIQKILDRLPVDC